VGEKLWYGFAQEHRTYTSLANQYGLSVKTIQKELDTHEDDLKRCLKAKISTIKPKSIVIVCDTTYVRRGFGVMVIRDAWRKRTITRRYVEYETVHVFQETVKDLMKKGWIIKGIVVDGRRGILESFPNIPTQMCRFHQIQIVTRYLTQRPKFKAGQELRKIALQLPKITQYQYQKRLDLWYSYWETFLKERTINEEKRTWRYTHRSIRSAYYSLKHNAPYLFTCKDSRYTHLNIPNTTNCLDGFFTHLKNSLRIHRGLKKIRKILLIESLLWD
jgi:hypothetical protein